MDPLHDKPIDGNAVRVMRAGEHFECRKKITTLHSSIQPELGPLPNNPTLKDLTGVRFGRFTVVGLLKGSFKRWVCRCACGRYAVRRRKAILNPANDADRCEECRYAAYLKNNEIWRRTGKDADPKDL